MKSKNFIQHQVFNLLRDRKLLQQKFLLAHSGGKDSTVLLHAMLQVVGPDKLTAFHFHHGGESVYRQQAHRFVASFCKQNGIRLVASRAKVNLTSEAEMRAARYRALRSWAKRLQSKVILTAHHEQDLFETQLINLIRGTGPRGLVAMSSYRESRGLILLRPLLEISQDKISEYCQTQKLSYVIDPSNTDPSYFRNWLRLKWLFNLEEKRPGSCHRFAQSLRLLAEQRSLDESVAFSSLGEISRLYYSGLVPVEQFRVLAQGLWQLGVREISQGQIREIAKRLKSEIGQYEFEIGKIKVKVSVEKIRLLADTKRSKS